MRVLMGDFGAIVRVGLRDVLDAEGDRVATMETATSEILPGLETSLPDVVVLDLDRDQSAELANEIVFRFPAIKVIACSADTPTMRIFPPFHGGESYIRDLNPTELIDSVLH